jgi:hypothetical protein
MQAGRMSFVKAANDAVISQKTRSKNGIFEAI